MPVAHASARAAASACVILLAIVASSPAQSDPSGLPRWVPADKRTLVHGGAPFVDVPSERGADFSVRAVIRTSVQSERFIAWSREVEQLHGGRYIPQIRRFTSPPKYEDVASLVLDDDELEDLQGCRPGRCPLKLAAHEITTIRAAARAAGTSWKAATQQAFREVVLARARDYLARGFSGTPLYNDHGTPEDPGAEFNVLMAAIATDPQCTPRIAEYLRTFPRHSSPVESIIYWSKDSLGDAKPMIGITHLAIFKAMGGEPPAAVATQVYATHYLMASVSIMSLVPTVDERTQFVLYTRRTRADVFDGMFGGLVRRIVSRRVRAEGAPVLESLRRKVERGDPAVRTDDR